MTFCKKLHTSKKWLKKTKNTLSRLMTHVALAISTCTVGHKYTYLCFFQHGVFTEPLWEKVCKNRQKRPLLLSRVYKVAFCDEKPKVKWKKYTTEPQRVAVRAAIWARFSVWGSKSAAERIWSDSERSPSKGCVSKNVILLTFCQYDFRTQKETRKKQNATLTALFTS